MPRQRSIWSPVLHRCYSHGEVGDKGSFGDLNIEHDILGLWGIIHQFALDHSGGHPRGNSGLDFVAIKSYLINIVLKLARTYNCSNKTSHGMHIHELFRVLYFTWYEQFYGSRYMHSSGIIKQSSTSLKYTQKETSRCCDVSPPSPSFPTSPIFPPPLFLSCFFPLFPPP